MQSEAALPLIQKGEVTDVIVQRTKDRIFKKPGGIG